MHFYTRFALLVSAFFLCLFYRAFPQQALIRYGKATGHLPTRIIVFGNALAAPQPGKPEVWPTRLCETLGAKCDIFAKAPNVQGQELFGATVDKLIFKTETPDFRDQVKEFVEVDEKREVVEGEKELYIVNFNAEEPWRLAEMRLKDASWAVDAAVDTLFEQLDILAARRPGGIQVVVTTGLDVTLLPLWRKTRYHKDITGQMTKVAFMGMKQYTTSLELRAKTWGNGVVYIYDSALWYGEEIRHPEKHRWKETRKPCVEGGKTCESPDERLMWDDVLLGERAQALFAAQIGKALW